MNKLTALNMLFQFTVLYVFTCFHYCYGKSPFRSCSDENPCDKHFFCDDFSMFCISCHDICNQKFSRLCGIYCADSEFIRNIEVTPSGSQIEKKLPPISHTTKNDVASRTGSTTVVNIEDTEDKHFGNVQGGEYITITYLILAVLAILVLVVLAVVHCTLFKHIRGSDQKHRFSGCCSNEEIDGQTTRWCVTSGSTASNKEKADVKAQLCDGRIHSSGIADL